MEGNAIQSSPSNKKKLCRNSELAKHCKELKQVFIKGGYQYQFFCRQFERLSTIEKESLFTPTPNRASKNRFPPALKFNKNLLNISEMNIYIYLNTL